MKKYGIITQYYKSTNYGGNLQAYALCMALRKIGIEAEQICYPTRKEKHIIYDTIKLIHERGVVNGSLKECQAILERCNNNISAIIHYRQIRHIREIEAKKKQAFSYFNSSIIPHSENIYTDEDLYLLVDKYDGLIVGSDQIWNPDQYRPGYFLEGIPDKGRKIAYAASIAKDKLSDKQKEEYAQKIQAFNMISVRENKAVEILRPLTEKEIYYTADPTLLLDAKDWEKVTDKRLINEPYAFCYFLGRNNESRQMSSEYAKKHNLKLMGIPMAVTNYELIDSNIFDVPVIYATPGEFLSGIKNAEVVFTDSFHACVFSHIFKKPFIVFQRETDGRMSSRIDSLMDLFETSELFIKNIQKDTLIQIEKILRTFDFGKKTNEENELIKQSYEFLMKSCI